MLCKNWLYVIANGIRMIIDVPFLLPFISSLIRVPKVPFRGFDK